MSLHYAETKIREVLKHTGGNKPRAQQIIAAMAQQDPKLLHALTKHHLNGIIAYHIERVLTGRPADSRPSTPANQASKPLSPNKPQQVTSKGNPFGMEILKAVAGAQGEVFGFDSGAPTGPRGKASQSHINAIHQIAGSGKFRK